MTSSAISQNHIYILPQHSGEKARLSGQHLFCKKVLGRDDAVPSWLDMSNMSNVLDMAAGSLVWIYDLLRSPDIQLRISAGSENPINLYACDITDVKFPSKAELEASTIRTFLQDITKPFPIEFKGKFDLVHMSFLRFSLTEEGWNNTMKNINFVLRSGGIVYLLETDTVFYSERQPAPGKDSQHNLEASTQGTSWIHKLNTIYVSSLRKNRHLHDLSYRLPEFLNTAGFSVVSFERNLAPFGKLCKVYKGLNKEALDDEFEISIDNLRLVTEAVMESQFSDQDLQAPVGQHINTDAKKKEVIDEIMPGVRDEGAAIILSEFVARKVAE